MSMRTKWAVMNILLYLIATSTVAQDIEREALLTDIRTLSSEAFAGRKPGTAGHGMAVRHITDRFHLLGLHAYHGGYLDTFALKDGGTGYNIIGYIPGLRKEAIVLSAHYDHLGIRDGKIHFGADDNASGVSALLALAGYFSRHPPTHTLIFAAFDAEELGLQGARAFVNEPPLPKGNTVLNVNMDMVSRNDKHELYACGTYHYPHLLPFMASANPVVTLKTGHDRPGSGRDDWTMQSDHAAFHRAGIPFVYFGVEDHPDYHTPNDTYANIQPDFFYNAVCTILDVVKGLDTGL